MTRRRLGNSHVQSRRYMPCARFVHDAYRCKCHQKKFFKQLIASFPKRCEQRQLNKFRIGRHLSLGNICKSQGPKLVMGQLHQPEKSFNDKRLYNYVLLPNGIQALLISDPEINILNDSANSNIGNGDMSDATDSLSDEEDTGSLLSGDETNQHIKKAAAALAVRVGSFSDPPDLQGLSHYLEHMLFMGSEKYSDENEYDSFLAKHGGSSNAYTEMEYTSYHFDVGPDQLHGALDRFAQFFIAPLCKADALDREVQAVNSEFVGVQQSDQCRLAQLRSHTAKEGHLYRKFTWGNRKSLVEQPAEAGIDVRQRLVTYYKEEYSAERMTLAVLGGDSLEVMETWVRDLFSHVPSGKGSKTNFKGLSRPYEGARLYLLPAVKEGHDLIITFQLPSLVDRYLAKADDYISSLVGHEGRGSLLSLLKARGWATALSAGVAEGGFERNTALYLFDVTVTLTETGLAAGPGMGLGVVKLLLEYLAMLRAEGPQQWVYQELADIGKMKSRFIEEEDATDYVTGVSANMHYVQQEHVLLSDYLFRDWDPSLITSLLVEMNPRNMRLDLQTSDFERLKSAMDFPDAKSSHEPWFDLPYMEASISQPILSEWEGIGSGYSPELQLPPRNNFIPTDFSLCCEADKDSTHKTPEPKRHKPEAPGVCSNGHEEADTLVSISAPVPVIEIDEDGLRLWHELDSSFKTPRSTAYFVISTPSSYTSSRAAAATHLLLRLLNDSLNETTYMADVAGLEYAMWPEGKNGVEMKVSGFSHKMPLLIETIFGSLAAYEVDEDNFGRVKEALVRKYRNANLSVQNHATYLRLRCLKQIWDTDDVLMDLESLKPSEIQDYLAQLLKEVHIELLLEGNVTLQQASDLARQVAKRLPSKPLPISERPKQQIAEIPEDKCYLLRKPAKNPEEDNSAVEVYFQCGPNELHIRACLDLLEQIASEPCFNVLRTQQQLGYSVHCGIRLTHNILGFAFTISSGSHSPAHLDARIEAFLTDFLKDLSSLPEEEFDRHREALIASKLQKDHSIQDQADRHWEQITSRRYRFLTREEEVEELRHLEKGDVVEAYRKYLVPESKKRRRLAVHVHGKKYAMELQGQCPAHDTAIQDPEQLRGSLAQYP